MYDRKLYVYKKIDDRLLSKFTNDILCYNKEYAKLATYKNLGTPLYIVRTRQNEEKDARGAPARGADVRSSGFRDTKITGYLMNFFDGYTTLHNLLPKIKADESSSVGIKFLKILKNTLVELLNIYNSGILPICEHGANIMVNDKQDIAIIDLDDIISKEKEGSTTVQVIDQLETIFINSSQNIELLRSKEYSMFFDSEGNIKKEFKIPKDKSNEKEYLVFTIMKMLSIIDTFKV